MNFHDSPLWLELGEKLATARERATFLGSSAGGDYFIGKASGLMDAMALVAHHNGEGIVPTNYDPKIDQT